MRSNPPIIINIKNMLGKPPKFDAALIPSMPAKLIKIQVTMAIDIPHTTLMLAGASWLDFVNPFVHKLEIAFVFESEAVTNDINTIKRYKGIIILDKTRLSKIL